MPDPELDQAQVRPLSHGSLGDVAKEPESFLYCDEHRNMISSYLGRRSLRSEARPPVDVTKGSRPPI